MHPRAYLAPGRPTGAPKKAQKWPKIAKMAKIGLKAGQFILHRFWGLPKWHLGRPWVVS